MVNTNELKRSQLEKLAEYRDGLRKSPHLRWVFFEITSRCNLSCRHCGSSCTSEGDVLSKGDIEAVLKQLDPRKTMLCLTGGEPLMHPSFFELAELVHSMGFSWGMTTNATLIDEVTAKRLKELGMATISVSLDGMEDSHDSLRSRRGAWRRAVKGIKALQEAGIKPMVTTVLHSGNFGELNVLYSFLAELGIEEWRPINVEPIGRACESSELMLTAEEFASLLLFIRNKRFDRECRMKVTFGCSHYLGVQMERMVRDNYFMCGAGIIVASVRCNGDICACLDVANRPELVQGNIRTDDFMDVWYNRFEAFRRDRTVDCEKCRECSERLVCGADSAHTWDYESNQPLLCYRDYAQELGDFVDNDPMKL